MPSRVSSSLWMLTRWYAPAAQTRVRARVRASPLKQAVHDGESRSRGLLLCSTHRALHPQPSAVSADEGPYSKGSKESTDQSLSSQRRSFSGTNSPALNIMGLRALLFFGAQIRLKRNAGAAHLPFTFTPIEQHSTMWTARQNESSDGGAETPPSEIRSKPFSFFFR